MWLIVCSAPVTGNQHDHPEPPPWEVGEVATLIPPRDVHNHGHVAGSGPSPYSLILLGDDMLLFEREEYDPDLGTWRGLAPGDPGRSHR